VTSFDPYLDEASSRFAGLGLSGCGTPIALVLISMHRIRGESWQAHRNVFCSTRLRGAVAHPLSRGRYHRLTGLSFKNTALVLDAHQPAENNGDFFEVWALTWLFPPLR
jgi:hypothetical protein